MIDAIAFAVALAIAVAIESAAFAWLLSDSGNVALSALMLIVLL